jgi:hypothetical protein
LKKRGGYNKKERGREERGGQRDNRRGGDNGRRNGGNARSERRGGEDSRGRLFERPKWQPPLPPEEPLPQPVCGLCGKPVRDIATAVDDKVVGATAHFDCVIAKIAEGERLEKGESIAYLGGGRFGIVRFSGSRGRPSFKINKILEWENKDNRAAWRKNVSDHYSLT